MILLFWVFEIIKHPLYWILYLFAYPNRGWARKNKNRNPVAWLLWSALDDSVLHDKETFDYATGKVKKEYFDYGIPKWLKSAPDWLKSWWWGAWRNNGVNLLHAIEIKEYEGIAFKIGNKCNFYEIKQFSSFPYFAPYFEFRIGKIMFSAGWLTCGAFQTLIRYRACK